MKTETHSWRIDYAAHLDALRQEGRLDHIRLREELTKDWLRVYKENVHFPADVVEICTDSFEYLFDCTSPIDPSKVTDIASVQCDRVVVVQGLSRDSKSQRDTHGMRIFPRGPAGDEDVVDSNPYDRGHLAAHAVGGGLGINLFPQLKTINRGWSDQGRRYRSMERYVASHPGTYFFSRPIYTGPSDHPYTFEFGYLDEHSSLHVEEFPNCRSPEEMATIEQALADRRRHWARIDADRELDEAEGQSD